MWKIKLKVAPNHRPVASCALLVELVKIYSSVLHGNNKGYFLGISDTFTCQPKVARSRLDGEREGGRAREGADIQLGCQACMQSVSVISAKQQIEQNPENRIPLRSSHILTRFFHKQKIERKCCACSSPTLHI